MKELSINPFRRVSVSFVPRIEILRDHKSEKAPSSSSLKRVSIRLRDHSVAEVCTLSSPRKLSSKARQALFCVNFKEGKCAFQLEARCNPVRFAVFKIESVLRAEPRLLIASSFDRVGKLFFK